MYSDSAAEPKPAERSHKKKKSLPVTDPAKTSLILFDEVNTLCMMVQKLFVTKMPNISQGSVATHLRCGILNDQLTTTLLPSVSKRILKCSVSDEVMDCLTDSGLCCGFF